MSDEENFELVRRFNQVPGKDLSVLDELVAPDFVVHGGNGLEVRGRESWRQFLLTAGEQFQGEDVESGIDELIGNGDLVAERWWIRTPVGIRRGITLHRVADGKLQEDWVVFEDIPADGATPPAAAS
ncbi:ester cyclase [Naasia sp. SYSU D00948]|uniref:ester cyclase n=1 Tax=Naasia sp. SYSU D00948 TaxID=2817379 RepID=UPI001B315CE7|nr:nuclear transport factor 2 family protein [Naasia sp. SYSU D00948]